MKTVTVIFRSFNREEVERLAKEFRMRVYRTSVKEDINVGNVFQHLAENYVHQLRLEQDLMRFDIGGPRSLCVQIGGGPHRSQSASPNEADRSCNGSTASSGSSSSSHSRSSGYYSLTDFGPAPSLRNSRSISTTSTGSNYLSPQDYLNNPMFDSLNSRSKLHWQTASGDRTITLKPLSMLTKKRKKSSTSSLQRKFGISSHHINHHQLITNMPPQPPSKSGFGSCKVL